jgi:hypothetical protein
MLMRYIVRQFISAGEVDGREHARGIEVGWDCPEFS